MNIALADPNVVSSETILSSLKNSFSIKKYCLEFREKWTHIILAGSLDSLTTIIAMNVFFIFELNPIVNYLFPDFVIFIPFVLIGLAFVRYSIARRIFQKPKHLAFAVPFTLYFLPVWNTANILYMLAT